MADDLTPVIILIGFLILSYFIGLGVCAIFDLNTTLIREMITFDNTTEEGVFCEEMHDSSYLSFSDRKMCEEIKQIEEKVESNIFAIWILGIVTLGIICVVGWGCYYGITSKLRRKGKIL